VINTLDAPCPKCGGATESVAMRFGAHVAAKALLWAMLAVFCGFGPLTGGFGWVLLLGLVPAWLYYASSGADHLRCTMCGEVLADDVGTMQRQQVEATERKRAVDADARRAAETRAKEQARAIDAKRVDPLAFCQKLAKTRVLAKTGVITEAEAETERKKVVAASVRGWTDQTLMDFLTPASELLQQGLIDPDDAKALKAVYAAIAKGRPPTAGDKA
jgi:hypothetical protein